MDKNTSLQEQGIIEIEQVKSKDGFFVTHYISDGATATNYDVFFTAIWPCEVLAVAETHRVAGTDGSDVTLNIEKLESGEALDAGDTILQTGFNLKSTANTPVIKTGKDLTFTPGARTLVQGDRLALLDTGTLTSVAGVQVTVYFKRLGKGDYR